MNYEFFYYLFILLEILDYGLWNMNYLLFIYFIIREREMLLK